jgi:hypothetical protein
MKTEYQQLFQPEGRQVRGQNSGKYFKIKADRSRRHITSKFFNSKLHGSGELHKQVNQPEERLSCVKHQELFSLKTDTSERQNTGNSFSHKTHR